MFLHACHVNLHVLPTMAPEKAIQERACVGLVVGMYGQTSMQCSFVFACEGAQLAFKHGIPMGCAMQVQRRKVLERGAASFADVFSLLFVDSAVFAESCTERRRVGAQRAAEHDFIVLL